MSCPYMWKPNVGREVYLHEMKTDHLQNLARWLCRALDEYKRVQIISDFDVPPLRIRNRLGTDWLIDVLDELRNRK